MRTATTLVVLALSSAMVAAVPQVDPHAERMTKGKLEADLGNDSAAAEAFAALAADTAAPAALRAEALVRLGLVRQRAGNHRAAVEAFEKVMKEYAQEEEAVRLLIQAVGDALPGRERWEKVWRELILAVDVTDPARPIPTIQWPGARLVSQSQRLEPSTKVVRVTGSRRPRYTGHGVSMDFANGDLQDVFRLFADITRLNIVVHPGISGGVTMRVQDMPWDEALDRILAANGLAYRLEGKLLEIAKRDKLPALREKPGATFTGRPITQEFQGIGLREVFEQLAAQDGLRTDVSAEVRGRVTLKVVDLPWDQVLDLVARLNGLAWTRNGDMIAVRPAKDAHAR